MRRAIFIAIALGLLAAQSSFLAAEGLEYQVKAAFLYNFLKFVEWPAETGDAPWVIGVLGHDPFGDMLDTTVRGKIVNGRSIEVRRYVKPADVKDCNILFVGREEFEKLGPALQPILQRPGLLSVGETSGFLKSGGVISFYLEENRVHFEIRSSMAHSVGLHVSSQLMKLGRVL